MNILIGSSEFEVLDAREKITIADSFVVRSNKIGIGNGEAKLYVGQESQELRAFFGNKGFGVKCFLLKKDLLEYLDETKEEYLKPMQPYVKRGALPVMWEERRKSIESMPDKIDFVIEEQSQIDPPRVYVKSLDRAYQLIREVSLPNITFISIAKLVGQDGHIEFYMRLFTDYFSTYARPNGVEPNPQESGASERATSRQSTSRARVGQSEFRKKVLERCRFCPVTSVSDDRLLIASHIKPWRVCNDFERIDPLNGFMFTPNIDYLFDQGFLSFTDDKKTIVSPFLSKVTCSLIGIANDVIVRSLPVEGSEVYLLYHRQHIFKG
jgi:putative restriction endonuclease